MAKQKKTSKTALTKKLIQAQLAGNELFKQRELLITNLQDTREQLQMNLNQQDALEQEIKNG